MTSSFERIGIVGRFDRRNVADTLERLLQYLGRRGISVTLDERSATSLQDVRFPVASLDDLGRSSDLVVILGGDGTLLHASRVLAPQGVPLIGINLGQLGFLTDIPAQSMEHMLGQVLDGKYIEEKRALLNARIARMDNEHWVGGIQALNDVVLTKGARGSMIDLEVFVDGQFVYNLRADGLIVATPTGSTAYALSSGGPIVHPGLGALLLVPICPHTLSNRPVVLNDRSQVEVILKKGEGAFVNFDVQDQMMLSPGDHMTVALAQDSVRLLHPQGHNYFAMLREKLRWGTQF